MRLVQSGPGKRGGDMSARSQSGGSRSRSMRMRPSTGTLAPVESVSGRWFA